MTGTPRILTEAGEELLEEHASTCPFWSESRRLCLPRVWRCAVCRRLCCYCNGVSESDRCDACWLAGDRRDVVTPYERLCQEAPLPDLSRKQERKIGLGSG